MSLPMAVLVRSKPGNETLAEAARRGTLQVLSLEGQLDAEVSVYLTDDQEIAELNAAFRGKEGPTDVLSFSQLEPGLSADVPPHEISSRLLGDVVISVETAAAQASRNRIPIEDEIAMLAGHGTLHLLGYEDETDAGAQTMEARLRAALTLPVPEYDPDA